MKRRRYDSTSPLFSPDLSISTMAYFRMKVAELEGRVKGSCAWRRTAHEIRQFLLQQIVCMCTDKQISDCAFELSREMHTTLFELLEPHIKKAETNLRELLDQFEAGTGPTTLVTIFIDLEAYWWPRQLAPHFIGWESVLVGEDLTEGRARRLITPSIMNCNAINYKDLFREIKHRSFTRLAVPTCMWWYDTVNTKQWRMNREVAEDAMAAQWARYID